MRVYQAFRENIDSDSENLLTISLFDIDKNIKLEDVLSKVKNIYSSHFSD